MKKALLILLVIPFFSFLSPDYKTSDFIGKWKGEDKGEIGVITFDNEGYASFEIGGEIMGGKEQTNEEGTFSMTYKIDAAAQPIHVDFIMTNVKTKEEVIMFGIAKFKDIDNMYLAVDADTGTRPAEFDTENTILLKRVK
ncbi:hypothetical protein [Cytophaga aurantiaca]|uniref:hypothetical protein n=1 Tax=Cytophaga aurantiaca TaxID=29530 RepID=UPI00037CBC54|nr:hypothetical protein [Cytophaga aurantiaca]